VTSPPPHTPNIFSSVLDDLQNDLCEEWGTVPPPQSPRDAGPEQEYKVFKILCIGGNIGVWRQSPQQMIIFQNNAF